MQFLLDEDLPPSIAEVARGLGLDVVSVHELDRRGLTDDEQLRRAAHDSRTFVTRNRDDFIHLTVEWFRAGQAHPGVLIVPRSLPNDRPERIAHALVAWAGDHSDIETLAYVIDFLAADSRL